MNNYAYITVLTNSKYIPGLRALINSLREVKSKYPLYVLIPDDRDDILLDFTTEDRRALGENKIIRKPNVEIPDIMKKSDNYWKYTFFKLQAIRCTQFNKIILLDCDMLIQRNIDNLFDRPHYSAVNAGESRVKEWVKLNSGLMVMEPNLELADKLIGLIPETAEKRKQEGLHSGDQDVFQEAFPRWKDNKELCLDETYNCFFLDMDYVCKAYKCRVYDVSVVHFYGPVKPWEYGNADIIKLLRRKYMKNPVIAYKMTKIVKKYIRYTKDITK